ncbi:GntR family transcriptional regulator [Sneathiella sp.]|uniref:GntR family transcriptional regulator n=1 Tax=Sneathiella sp. TaxID=1964365 RepID=UPI00262F66AC|nr:GntR family transcriptional regulator [Sneathiella sp.]MDF2367101.1 GntR family transcriptional regulator [Sneathiella sp.]
MKNKYGAVRMDTYERLKKAIITGKYAPGELVQISEFARDLGVSRTPVREALSAIERDFLVDLIDGRGAIIRPLNIDEVRNINQLREIVDGLAARLSAKLMPGNLIAELKEKFESMLDNPEMAESEAHSQLSHELHKTITDSCGNWVVQAQWRHLDTAFLRLKQKGWEVWRNSEEKREISLRRLNEHLEILDALEKRDPERAERAARTHIVRATEDFLKFMNSPYQ